MAYQPYGNQSPIWSAEEYTPWSPPGNQFRNLAIGAALGGAAFYKAATTSIGEGKFAIDLVQSHWRAASERTPFAILNTFRVSEFLSPFVSGAAKNLPQAASVLDSTKQVRFYEYGAEFVSSKETKEYLKHILSKEAFENLGMNLDGDFELRYEQNADGRTGKLLGRRVEAQLGSKSQAGGWSLLSNKVGLMEAAPYEARPFGAGQNVRYSQHKGINTAFYSVLQSLGLTEFWGLNSQTKAESLFAVHGPEGFKYRKSHIPIPLEATRSMSQAGVMAAYASAPLAFGMERFNRLISNVIEQVPFLSGTTSTLEKNLGFRLGVQSGKPLNMFMRYGGRAAALGALYGGVQQADWMRRNFGLPGDVLVAGGTSAAAAFIFNKVKKSGSPRTAFAVGLASFFGQMILPGFDQGIIPGIATTATKAHVAASAIGAATGMSHYRKTLEGLFPGISDWKTGALAGVAMTIATMPDFVTRGGLPGMFLRRMSPELKQQIGLGQSLINAQGVDVLPKSLSTTMGDTLYSLIHSGRVEEEGPLKNFLSTLDRSHIKGQLGINNPADLGDRLKRKKLYGYMYGQALKQGGQPLADDMMRELHFAYEASVKSHRESLRNNNLVNKALAEKLDEIGNRYSGETGFSKRLAKGVSGFRAKFVHALFGATLTGEELLGDATKGTIGVFEKHGFSNRLGKVGTLFAGTFGLHQLLTGALFGSMDGPSELSAIYSGQKMVEVRRGRWWEGGGTPFEGADIKYHRPHAYVALMTRSRQKAAWGDREDEISPIRKFFLKNFTYYLEEANYWDRPYPISGAAFEDIPVVGGLLSATVGRIVKPPKLMHTSEYMRPGPDGTIEFKHKPEINGPEIGLGGRTPGVPYSPFSAGYVAGTMQYQFRELEGLTGWAKNMVQKGLTGTENFGTQRPIMASAGSITDPGEAFWDMNLGGGFFMTEAVRRFLPRKRSEVEEYNPLLNRMPHWLPDRFKYGDPYRNVETGHLRLPGSGYEAIHPELKGFSPEDYPDIYKYSILADVAPNSKEFFQLRQRMYHRRAKNITTSSENALMDSIDRMYNERITTDFDRVHPNAVEIPFISNVTQEGVAAGQKLIRKAVAPVENLIPGGFRPVQKLMSDRDMIEEYEYKRMYGTQFAFWDKPIRDWLRPSAYSLANLMGYQGKPAWRIEADEQQEYFDKLEFRKHMYLAQKAGMEGRGRDKRIHLAAANRTRYGVNPQSSAMSMYMSMPDSEKEFFDAFSMASEKERGRILEMIPSDQRHLYETVWRRLDRGDPTLYVGSDTSYSEAHLNKQFHNLQDYHYNNIMPREDWIGWHEDVNLDDVQLRYNESLGKDLHEYGYWHSGVRQLARKQYLEGSDSFLHAVPGPEPFSIAGQLFNAGRHGIQYRAPMESSVSGLNSYYSGSHGNFYMNDDRSMQIDSMAGIFSRE